MLNSYLFLDLSRIGRSKNGFIAGNAQLLVEHSKQFISGLKSHRGQTHSGVRLKFNPWDSKYCMQSMVEGLPYLHPKVFYREVSQWLGVPEIFDCPRKKSVKKKARKPVYPLSAQLVPVTLSQPSQYQVSLLKSVRPAALVLAHFHIFVF